MIPKIFSDLVNTAKKTLLSDENIDRVSNTIVGFLDGLKKNPSKGSFLDKYEQAMKDTMSMVDCLTILLCEKNGASLSFELTADDFERVLSEYRIERVDEPDRSTYYAVPLDNN